jgi:hypothetical protein
MSDLWVGPPPYREDLQPRPSLSGGSVTASHLRGSFSHPHGDGRTQLPPTPLEVPALAMADLSSWDQFPNMMAAAPSFPELEVPTVLPPRQSIHVNAHRMQPRSAPDSPRSRPAVHGFYSKQMKVAKTTGGKTKSKRKVNDSGGRGGR